MAVQVDTLAACSVDAVTVVGVRVWTDLNCTDKSLEGIREDQSTIIEEMLKGFRRQSQALKTIEKALEDTGGTPPTNGE